MPLGRSKLESWLQLGTRSTLGDAATLGMLLLSNGNFKTQERVVVSAASACSGGVAELWKWKGCCLLRVRWWVTPAPACCAQHRAGCVTLSPPTRTVRQRQNDWLNAALRVLPPSVLEALPLNVVEELPGRVRECKELYLYAPLLQGWQAPALAPLLSHWEEAGLLVRGGGGALAPAFPFDDFPLVFKVGRRAWVRGWRPG